MLGNDILLTQALLLPPVLSSPSGGGPGRDGLSIFKASLGVHSTPLSSDIKEGCGEKWRRSILHLPRDAEDEADTCHSASPKRAPDAQAGSASGVRSSLSPAPGPGSHSVGTIESYRKQSERTQTDELIPTCSHRREALMPPAPTC